MYNPAWNPTEGEFREMADELPVGKVQTVLGPVDPSELGVTLTHEHLLINLGALKEEPEEATAWELYHSPLEGQTLAFVRSQGLFNADNARLTSVDTAIEEAMLYKQFGGDTLVDATSIGIARDPVGLVRISRATGVKVVMGASHYVAPAHPPDMDSRSEDEIMDRIVRDVTEGVDRTRIRSGIIGEVGCSWPLDDNERKVLRASGRAQRLTGAPLLIHPGRDENAPLEIVEVLTEVGADIGHTIIGHLDRTVFRRGTLKKLAETGCYLEWDLFGWEQSFYYPAPDKIAMPGDVKRMDDIAWIASQGYGEKIVVAHDICSKHRLVKYGGHGYFYLLAHIVPRMRQKGFSDELIENLFKKNPASALTFAEPASA